MAILHSSIKPHSSSKLTTFFLISSSLGVGYFLSSLFLFHTFHPSSTHIPSPDLSLNQIVFGIASNKDSWPERKDYAKIWWKPNLMRGCVFVDDIPQNHDASSSSLPAVCVSADTSRFRYTYRGGPRSAIRVARVVLETVAAGHSDVRWYVFGDDDTFFFPENLVRTLSKYDDGLWYYIGSNSETYFQNRKFGFEMGFGGAGFAISQPLAKTLRNVFDSCLERYPHLYGSDSRVHSCLTELGVKLTHEQGFHQVDLRGDIFGLLASHPLTPLVTLHHLDHINPIFPNKTTQESLQHLYKAVEIDPYRVVQQSVCYDRWFSWTISVSWGYAVQIYDHHVFLTDAINVQQTFSPWQKDSKVEPGSFTFNTREIHEDPCRRPTVFYLDQVSSDWTGLIKTTYKKDFLNCSFGSASPRRHDEVRVFSRKLNMDAKQLQAPRRQCCDVLPSTAAEVLEMAIRDCKEEEMIHMH
ncbi:DUF604 domain-containing protein [Cucumis melo var. makuwa]|uniref:DUF604 domain-containing protein n=2 Tax=Cucumis melo TaxID=3656 RepID=A0A5A7SSE9_CUCMM|nr:uncharacterized protein LOC103495932 [Cucumis melo]KAA0032481.1 DUF604 domain-containing protein [Cucumis melo var. makuwa]